MSPTDPSVPNLILSVGTQIATRVAVKVGGVAHPIGVGEVTHDYLQALLYLVGQHAQQARVVARVVAHETPYLCALSDELLDQMTADKSTGTGY